MYVCKKCGEPEQILIPYPQARIQNPYAGPSYRCKNCNTIYDSSLVKLSRPARKLTSTIGSERDIATGFILETVKENSGLYREDEYKKYDPDPSDEEMILGMGGTIIHSSIEICDSLGVNRTIVRKER